MRRIVFNRLGAPDVLWVVEEALPSPVVGEVAIEVRAAGRELRRHLQRAGAYLIPVELPGSPCRNTRNRSVGLHRLSSRGSVL